ncbi:MAG: hypothetical protein QM662_18750 [Gordonia sp. (in: high G+C Gram-positive bacteria)]
MPWIDLELLKKLPDDLFNGGGLFVCPSGDAVGVGVGATVLTRISVADAFLLADRLAHPVHTSIEVSEPGGPKHRRTRIEITPNDTHVAINIELQVIAESAWSSHLVTRAAAERAADHLTAVAEYVTEYAGPEAEAV